MLGNMKLGEVDLNAKPIKPRLSLCLPNKSIISRLTEAYEIKFSNKLGILNELTFRLPLYVERSHQQVRNRDFDLVKGRYIVKFELGNYSEYFMITRLDKDSSENTTMTVNTLSLGFELNDKIIRDYKGVSKTASEYLNDFLKGSNWTRGYIDSEFDLKFRGMEVSSSTTLELVFELAKTFNALVIWDTHNRKVSFYKPDLVGLNRGFKIKYGKYLQSINEEDNSEEVITRLKMYGKEDLSIRGINPTGTNYIEDFSYFIHPFSRDNNRNVLSHSEYMSDELCHALLDYDNLLQTKKLDFQILLGRKEAQLEVLTIKQNELFDLETELKKILDDRDIANTLGRDTTQIVLDMNAKQNEVNQKENEILVVETEIDAIDNEMIQLGQTLSIEANFSPTLIKERNQFIIEKEWQDSNITDPKDLLAEGQIVFADLRTERITVKIDIVNFLTMIPEQRNWDKINIGDTFKIEHEKLNLLYSAKIVEIEYDFDSDSIRLVISNVKDLNSNRDKFLEMLYKSYSSSTQVSIDKWKWDLSLENNGSINDLINNMWDANKQAIEGGKDQSVSISDRGLIIRDPNDPSTYLVGLNSMIAITDDGGNTWKHAITSKGIVGERIYGKIIMGVNLAIEDADGVLKFQGSKGSIFDRQGNLVMKLGLVEENPDCFGMVLENEITQVKVTSCEGFAITRNIWDGTDYKWEKIMWTNPQNGTLYTKDLVAERLKIVNNIGDTILNAETHFFDISQFREIVLDGVLTSLEKIEVLKEWERVKANYVTIKNQGDKFAQSDRNSQTLITTTELTRTYNNLGNYLAPLLLNMNETSTVDRAVFVLKFKEYYDEVEKIRNAIEDALKYSSLQLGEYYNNVMIDETNGFIAVRSDFKYRAYLNATHGLALEKWESGQWVKKLYATLGDPNYEDGTLVAEDLVARRLKIIGKAGQVMIDGDAGILDFTQFTTIVGTLKAENIISDVITSDIGFIADLAVNKVVTIDKTNSGSVIDYIHIEKNFLNFVTGTKNSTTYQATDSKGNLLYWTDSTKKERTVDATSYPVMVQGYDEAVKMKLHSIQDSNGNKYPIMEFGGGAGGVSGKEQKGYIYQDTKEFVMEYFNKSTSIRTMTMREDGIIVDVEKGTFTVSSGDFLVTKLPSDTMSFGKATYTTYGGFYVPETGEGVFNKYKNPTSGVWASRWMFDNNNYIYYSDKTVNFYIGNNTATPSSEKIKLHFGNDSTVLESKWALTTEAVNVNTVFLYDGSGTKRIKAVGTLRIEAGGSSIELNENGNVYIKSKGQLHLN